MVEGPAGKKFKEEPMIRKFGKEINMLSMQQRDMEKKLDLILSFKLWAEKNLVPFSNNENYFCRLCHSKKHHEFAVIYGYHYAECENCGSIILLNIPLVKKLYTSECSVMTNAYLDETYFLNRCRDIALPKVEFIFDVVDKLLPIPPNGGGGINFGVT
jgi:DNA-directed RNA polymerase subunit RPC12/RpoP